MPVSAASMPAAAVIIAAAMPAAAVIITAAVIIRPAVIIAAAVPAVPISRSAIKSGGHDDAAPARAI